MAKLTDAQKTQIRASFKKTPDDLLGEKLIELALESCPVECDTADSDNDKEADELYDDMLGYMDQLAANATDAALRTLDNA